jgi:hypothetical protein
MLDFIYAFGTITTMLYTVLAIGFETYNPIEQVKALSKNLGIFKGIAIVVVILISTILLTNKVEAAEYNYEMEIGLDRPFSGTNIGCVVTGDQTASNINIRALMPGDVFRYGLSYNHQSCAANEDWRTSDRLGLTALLDYPYIRIETAIQTWKDSQTRIPITVYVKMLTLDQYQFVSFIQKQLGTYNEESFGVALVWRF